MVQGRIDGLVIAQKNPKCSLCRKAKPKWKVGIYSVIRAFHVLFHLVLSTTTWGRYY